MTRKKCKKCVYCDRMFIWKFCVARNKDVCNSEAKRCRLYTRRGGER